MFADVRRNSRFGLGAMAAKLLLMMLVVLITAKLQAQESRRQTFVLEDCVVSLHDQALIPAQQAGVLTALTVREGAMVQARQTLGYVDSTQQQLKHSLAEIERQAALEKSEEDIDIRFSKASAAVAETEYQRSMEANQRVKNTIPMPEVRRLQLAAHKTSLQVEKSMNDHEMAKLALSTQEAEVRLAANELARCQISSPIQGQVVEILRRPGEWVDPGDPIARVVRLDVLRVEGFLNTEKHDPLLFEDGKVNVSISLTDGRREVFPGKIVFVSPLIQVGSQYRIWAEVENRETNQQWLMRPGMSAQMELIPHLK